ncbi:MAG: prolyl-tRNA synthetase associated domain-containing protein [Eubacterium sp.]|nr:prolyl-tRNA synthetase associated domain-containing protein [Eubacterium sp.]
MINVSEIITSAPNEFKTPLQEQVYNTLQQLNIPFERVDTDEAITMEDCIAIREKLNCRVVKTLFLCNRQKTSFYLFITTDDKPFVTKDFSHTLGISRVSFAPEELLLEMVGVKIGATTVFGALLDSENKIKIIFDNDVLKEEYYGCSDGTTTGYMKVKTNDIFNKFLQHTKHSPTVIEV